MGLNVLIGIVLILDILTLKHSEDVLISILIIIQIVILSYSMLLSDKEEI